MQIVSKYCFVFQQETCTGYHQDYSNHNPEKRYSRGKVSKDCLAFGLLILMKVEQKGLRSGLLALVVDVDEVLDLGAVGQVVRLLNTVDHQ